MQRPGHFRGDVQFDTAARSELTANLAAANDYCVYDYFGIDVGAISDYQGVITTYFTLEATVDADPPFEVKLSFEMGSASK